MKSRSMMEQWGPRQCFLPQQAQNYSSCHAWRCWLLEQKWLCNHYPRWLHLSPAQDPLNLSHIWSKPARLIQRQHFFLTYCETNACVCFSWWRFTCDCNQNGHVKGGERPSPASHLPFTALQAARKPRAGIRRTAFFLSAADLVLNPSSTRYSATLGTVFSTVQ